MIDETLAPPSQTYGLERRRNDRRVDKADVAHNDS